LRLACVQGGVPDVELEIKITDLVAPADALRPDCDYESRASIPGTLEFIRMNEVCRVELINHTATTDDNGRASFKGLRVRRGPQGTYAFTYRGTTNTTIINSQETYVFISSNAASLEVVGPGAPFTYSTGSPFDPQPRVRVRDLNGNPVQSKRVVAFSWPESVFSGSFNPYIVEGTSSKT
jgi:hypothetical protein